MISLQKLAFKVTGGGGAQILQVTASPSPAGGWLHYTDGRLENVGWWNLPTISARCHQAPWAWDTQTIPRFLQVQWTKIFGSLTTWTKLTKSKILISISFTSSSEVLWLARVRQFSAIILLCPHTCAFLFLSFWRSPRCPIQVYSWNSKHRSFFDAGMYVPKRKDLQKPLGLKFPQHQIIQFPHQVINMLHQCRLLKSPRNGKDSELDFVVQKMKVPLMKPELSLQFFLE